MRKLKLLMAACALLGASTGFAKTDVTNTYLKNSGLTSLEGWTILEGTMAQGGYQDWKTDGDVPVIEFYHSWNANPNAGAIGSTKTFNFSQVANLPAGYYRLAVNAFYREGGNGNGTNTKTYIYAGEKQQFVVGLNEGGLNGYSGGNDLYKAANAFSKGDYSNEFDFHVSEAGEIEIGFHGYIDTYCSWCILGPVTLWEYTAEDYMEDYSEKVPEATALYDKPMNGAVLEALKAAVVEESTLETVDDVSNAITTLTNAILAAKLSIANYEAAKAILDAANGYDETGQASYAADETIATIQTAYDDRSFEALTNEQKAAAVAALATACKAQTQPAEGCNMTPWIVNPDFAAGNSNGWTKDTPLGGNCQIQGGTRMEYWAGNASNRAEASFNIYQVINDIPDGVYQVTAYMYNSLNGEGGDYTEFSPTCGVYGIGINEGVGLVTEEGTELKSYTTDNIFVYGGKLTVGVKNTVTPMAARWFLVDKFELTYVRALTSDDIDNLVGPAKEAWTAALASANEAYTAHETAQSFPEGEALNEEIGKSEPSDIDGYTAATTALNEATAAFLVAAPSYEAYVAYKAETESLFGTNFNVAVPTTAAEADGAVHALNIAQFNEVADNYKFSCTGVIGDFGSWIGTATVGGKDAKPNYLDYEHWSGDIHAYYEQASNGWGNATGWTIKYEKTCTLPAGEYVIKVAARSSAGTSSLVSCSATDITTTLPNIGASGRGININGAASWSDSDSFVIGNNNNTDPAAGGKGLGWQWRFLPFTLTEQKEVTMTFYAEATTQYQWMSIADGELLSKTKLSQEVSFDEATSNTIEDVLIADVTMTRTIKEGYNTVVVPFDLTANQVAAAFGTGTEVYAFSENSENAAEATVNFNKGDGSITANTPVLIKATEASTSQTFEGVQIKAAEAVVAGKNFDFVGTFAPISAIAAGDYFIGNGAVYRSEGSTSLNAFRAYIQAKSAGARIVKFFIDGVETTGIEGVVAAKNSNSKIYNLAGQEVKNAQKGLYIVNGKKVVIK